MSEKIYQLIMQQGPQIGQIFPLLAHSLIIGRDPLVDVVISDPEVSRQHARLTQDEAGYQIQDLGSTNGTFVNGQRLTGEPLLLQAGQEILLGSSIVLKFMEAVEGASNLLAEIPGIKTAAITSTPELAAWDENEDVDDLPAVPFPTIEESIAQHNQPDLFAPPATIQPAVDLEPDAEPIVKPPSSPIPKAETAHVSAPPLVAHDPNAQANKQKRIITWAIVVILLLICCCCAFFLSAWYWWGDPLMRQLGVY